MDIEKFISANQSKLKILGAFALVFVLGFSSGFYFHSEAKSSEVLTISGADNDCAELFKSSGDIDAGSSLEGGTQTDIGDKTGTNAGSTAKEASTKQVPSPSVTVKAYAGSKNSTIYHTPNCSYVKQIKPENLVWFASEADAEAAGRKPHKCVK